MTMTIRRIIALMTFLATALNVCPKPPQGVAENEMLKKFEINVVRGSKLPIIDEFHKGAHDNVGGFENGSVIKLENGEYHMLVVEMFVDGEVLNQGIWSPARIAHWVSIDAVNWDRKGLVIAGNAIPRDEKENSWSPSFFWNKEENCWNIFWRGNAVFRYKSTVKGKNGIAGPYVEANKIWPPFEADKSHWHSGWFASFGNIFKAKDERWYAFFCIGKEVNGDENWYAGLACAESIDGKWVPNINTNAPTFLYSENPFVYKYDDVYFCVYDDLSCQKSIGLGYSYDGMHWERQLVDLTHYVDWCDDDWYVNTVRTPMSLIKEDDGTYTVFFTAAQKTNGYFSIGSLSLSIERVLTEDKSNFEVNLKDEESFTPLTGGWHIEYNEYSQNNKEDFFNMTLLNKPPQKDLEIEASLRCVDVRKMPENEKFFHREQPLFNTRGGIFIGKVDKHKDFDENALYIYLTADKHIVVFKGKHLLELCKVETPPFIFKNLKVSVVDKTINVYYQNESKPRIQFVDESYNGGYLGLVVDGSHWHYESVHHR